MSLSSTITKALKVSLFEHMKSVNTSIAGNVIAFDPDTQLAQLQIGVVRINTKGEQFNPPPIIECPVQFVGGAGGAIEHEIVSGDECLIVFSQRCLDGWIETGGIAQQSIIRFHDANDAVALMGVRSMNNVLPDFQNQGIRIRNKSGDTYVHVNGSNIEVKTPNGEINLNGVIIDASGTITLPNGVVLNTHGHNQGPDSDGNSQQKTTGPVNQ